MAICASRENWLQEATSIRRGRVYPVAENDCNSFTITQHIVNCIVWNAHNTVYSEHRHNAPYSESNIRLKPGFKPNNYSVVNTFQKHI